MHQIQLVVKPPQSVRHCYGISNHTNRTVDLGKVAAGDDDWQLVIDA
jgi:hypothetical protein